MKRLLQSLAPFKKYYYLAISLGLFLALGIAFLRELTDSTVRSPSLDAREP